MKPKEFKMFKWSQHKSGSPWAHTECCGGRINRQLSIKELQKPLTYGMATDRPVTLTHEARYSCKCGKTVVIIEGTMESISLTDVLWKKKSKKMFVFKPFCDMCHLPFMSILIRGIYKCRDCWVKGE